MAVQSSLCRTWLANQIIGYLTQRLIYLLSDMKEANTKNSDKYFHAKANYEAANRGPGGKKAAELIR